MSISFNNEHVSCIVDVIGDQKIIVQGKVTNANRYRKMEVLAPHPIDRRTSYHGSGLPFPCPKIALDGTPNTVTPDKEGNFFATFAYPNSYYTVDGTTKVKPSIFVALTPNNPSIETIYIRFELPEDPTLFLRTLTYRPGHGNGPIFYAAKDTLLDPLPRSAEHVMRSIKELKETADKAV